MIEVLGVCKYYGGNVGVADLTFVAGRGDVVGLLGPNGAGKTTTLRMITGYLLPSRGTVRIAGADLWAAPLALRRRIGYLPDRPPLYREMSVRAYVSYAAALRGVPRAERRQRVAEAVAACGLAEVTGRLVGHLSRGYQQRVGLAQAIVHDPALLVLDEPTVGLDPRQIHELRELIRRLGRERTVVLSSHILPEVSMLCNRVLILDRGRVLAEDAPERLARSLRGTSRFRARVAGEPAAVAAALAQVPGVSAEPAADGAWQLEAPAGSEVRPALFYALAAAQLPLLELTPLHLSLEDVFLRLTTAEAAGHG